MQTFEAVLDSVVKAAHIAPRSLSDGECQSASGLRCKLCHAVNLDYQTELRLKNQALQQFWKTLRVRTPLSPLAASPLGRNYRTTSKRKVFLLRDSVKLGLLSPNEAGEIKPFGVLNCAIEPHEHAAVYRQVQESIVKPYAKPLAKAMTYVIIKGSGKEQTVICNVRDISTDVIHAANTLSKTLSKKFESVVGFFLYEDSTSPDYYMGAKNQKQTPRFRKLHGKSEIFHRTLGRSFLYSPLSFSQINQSILEKMIGTAQELLKPAKNSKLFDLYCGYGLFALCLAEHCESVVGAELSPSSIDAAIANARRQKVSNARFLRSDINEETIERIMQQATPNDVAVLDPPRKGTSEGVIECIAAKEVRRVVHIFCEIDLIAKELKRWDKNGYAAVRAIPFDMFPGTATMETMVLLEKA